MLVKNSLLSIFIVSLIVLSAMFGSRNVEPVYAATLIVTNSNNSGAGSLRQAILDAASGDIITFHPSLSGQTITLVSPLVVDKNLVIDGSSLGSAINISGNNSVTVMFINSFSIVRLQRLMITNGKSPENGGGVFVNTGSSLTIVNSTLSENTAATGPYAVGSGEGGAVYSLGTLVIANSSFLGNTAYRGGAISCSGSSSIDILNSTFSFNQALSDTGGDGGAIYASCGGGISSSTFASNTAAHNGGAILSDHDSAPIQIINNTFYDNTALAGGGIAVYGQTVITNSTFSGNHSANGGAMRIGIGGVLSLRNSILANSTGGPDCVKSDGVPSIQNSNNLIETTGLKLVSCGTSLLTSDPLLGPLQNNGGPTQTMALNAGSPAFNAGNAAYCPATDQRGVSRPQGNPCDLGAYEYESAVPTITLTWTPTATVTPTFTATYHVTVTITTTASGKPTRISIPTNTPIPPNTPTHTNTPGATRTPK